MSVIQSSALSSEQRTEIDRILLKVAEELIYPEIPPQDAIMKQDNFYHQLVEAGCLRACDLPSFVDISRHFYHHGHSVPTYARKRPLAGSEEHSCSTCRGAMEIAVKYLRYRILDLAPL